VIPQACEAICRCQPRNCVNQLVYEYFYVVGHDCLFVLAERSVFFNEVIPTRSESFNKEVSQFNSESVDHRILQFDFFRCLDCIYGISFK